MKRITIFSIAIIMIFLTAAGMMSGNAYAASEEVAPVSTGLAVLSARSSMAVSGVTGSELGFAPEDFERALNLRRISYITVTKVPDPSLGTLYLGSEGVSVGKTIARENLHKLSYSEKAEGMSANSFTFTTGEGYEIECSIYMLLKENLCPVAGGGGELSSLVSTYRNVSVYGRLSGSDPEGDEIRYEVVSYPKKGSVTLLGAGEFRYTPRADRVGSDSFSYVVRDKYGNYSAAATVDLEIDRTRLSSVLSDMGGERAHAAAISMVENGIMSCAENEGKLCFSPDKKLSREDFLVMAMKAAGLHPEKGQSVSGEAAEINTGFADDGDISDEARGYVYLASKKGFVKGSSNGSDSRFYPKKEITSAEAAVIIDNIIGASDYVSNSGAAQTVFADHVDIPVWAESSIRALSSIGVMADTNGYIYPEKTLDRATAAQILHGVMRLTGE